MKFSFGKLQFFCCWSGVCLAARENVCVYWTIVTQKTLIRRENRTKQLHARLFFAAHNHVYRALGERKVEKKTNSRKRAKRRMRSGFVVCNTNNWLAVEIVRKQITNLHSRFEIHFFLSLVSCSQCPCVCLRVSKVNVLFKRAANKQFFPSERGYLCATVD